MYNESASRFNLTYYTIAVPVNKLILQKIESLHLKMLSMHHKLELNHLIFIIPLIIFALRDLQIVPSIFVDELDFSLNSRKRSMAESTVPDYIYNLIYKLTNFGGEQFVTFMHILNMFFFTLSIYMVRTISLRLTNEKGANYAAFLFAISPLNSFTGYFTAEILFNFVYLILIYALICHNFANVFEKLIVITLLSAVLSLVKPHGVFVSLTIFVYIFVARDNSLKFVAPTKRLMFASLYFVSTLISKLIISYFLAGKDGFTIFGSVYNDVASPGNGGLAAYFKLVMPAIHVILNHLLLITLLCFPFIILIVLNLEFIKSGNLIKLFDFVLISAFFYVPFVGFFTAKVAGPNLSELNRFHTRYYDFLLAILIVLVSATSLQRSLKISHLILTSFGAAFLCIFWIRNKSQFVLNPFDSPELFGFSKLYLEFIALTLLSVLVSFLIQDSMRTIKYVFIPIFILLLTLVTSRAQFYAGSRTDVDKFSNIASNYLIPSEFKHTLILTKDKALADRVRFNLDSDDLTYDLVDTGTNVYPKTVSSNFKYVICLDNIKLNQAKLLLHKDIFRIYRMDSDLKDLSFMKFSSPGLLSEYEGLSLFERWGVWSDASKVVLIFDDVLPTNFILNMQVKAFGPNIGAKTYLIVDEKKYFFTPTGEFKSFEFSVANLHNSKKIEILVFRPTSPKSLGVSEDNRALGLGLRRLTIRNS